MHQLGFVALACVVAAPCWSQPPLRETPRLRVPVDERVLVREDAGLADQPRANVSSTAAQAFRVDPDLLSRGNVSVYSAGETTRLTPDNFSNLVNTSSVLIERTGDNVVASADPSGLQRFTLPIKFTQVEIDSAGTAQTIQYAPEVLPRTALRYFGDRREYVATVGVGVFEPNPSGARALTERIGVALASVTLSKIDPIDLNFDRLNSYQNVEVTTQSLTSAPSLSLRPDFEPASFDVPVPVGERPTLTLRFSSPSMLGLGLGTATTTVQVANVVNPGGLEINLEFDGGSMSDDGRIVLDGNGRGSVGVRSTGIGAGRIWSEEPLFANVDDDTIGMTLPWLFLLAVLAGGAAGTVATKRGREAWGGALLTGIVIGIIVVAAYAVGINLLGIEPKARTGEALAFVLAALGAAAGPAILSRKGEA